MDTHKTVYWKITVETLLFLWGKLYLCRWFTNRVSCLRNIEGNRNENTSLCKNQLRVEYC